MKLLIDMNLSPSWAKIFARYHWDSAHWSEIGDPGAPDQVIMEWARANGFVVFTHDLDFGAILAATRAEGPSVIQIRTQDVSPEHLEKTLVNALRQHLSALEAGALIIVDEHKSRVRVLPLSRSE